MQPQTVNLTVYQGDDYAATLTFTDSNNDPLDLSAFVVEAQMRRNFTSDDPVIIAIDDEDANVGEIGLSLPHEATSTLMPGEYVWDIQRATVTIIPGGLESTQDEQQGIDIGQPTGGTWTITFDGQTTDSIAWDASAEDVESALEALSNIGSGNVSVGVGDEEFSFVISFINALGATDHDPLVVDVSSLDDADGTLVETIQQGGEQFFPDEINYSDVLTLAAGKVTVIPEVTKPE